MDGVKGVFFSRDVITVTKVRTRAPPLSHKNDLCTTMPHHHPHPNPLPSRTIALVNPQTTEGVWNVLKPQLFSKILDFYGGEDPQVMLTRDTAVVSDTTILDDDSEVVAMIKELMETRVRPAVQDDGGDIFFEGFNEATGIVSVRLAGSCVGCPSSSITLRNGVENMLQHYIAEVKGIEEVGGEGGDDDEGDQELKLSYEPHTHT